MDYKTYKPMIELLPYFLRDVTEYNALYTAFEVYFLDLGQEIQRMRLRVFYDDLDEAGCEMWEDIMGLSVRQGATLQERIEAIKSTAANYPPYTDETLEARLTNLLGEDGYRITRDYDNYSILIELYLSDKGAGKDVENMLRNILPCNLDVFIRYLYETWFDCYCGDLYGGEI